MWQYLVKRLFLLLVTLFGICLISFIVVQLAPGDPAYTAAGIQQGGKGRSKNNDEVLEHTRKALYLDRPRLLNLAPNSRARVARELAKKIAEGSEYARVEARKNVAGGVGTAALEVFVEEAVARAARATAEADRLTRAFAELDALASAAAPDPAALEGKLAELEKAIGERGPRTSRRAAVAERSRAWAAWGKDHARDVLAGVTALLDIMDGIVKDGPGATGGPTERAAAWTAWWQKNGARYSLESARKAVLAYLDAPEAERPGRLAEVERIGGAATGSIMAELEGSTGERRRLAAFALSLVAHKPWDLTVTDQERRDYENKWQSRKDRLERAHEDGQIDDAVLRQGLAELGTKEAFVARESAADLRDQERSIARWWFRAEEEYVDFSTPRQIGRAFTQTQFGNWFRALAFGLDFGKSFAYKGQDVSKLILDRLPTTLWLNFFAIFFTYLIAIPLGIFSATHPKTLADRLTTVALFVLYSLPSFWVGAVLILLFTGPPIGVSWFPSHGIESVDAWKMTGFERFVDWIKHMVLPVTCLTYGGVAYISRQMRAGMLETIRQDFVRTARAKGLPENVVIFKHALRNSLIPIVTILAYLLPFMFGGSVIIESIFSIHGLGRLMFDAILARDLPVIMAEVFISGALTLLGILLADITYAIVDPRIELK